MTIKQWRDACGTGSTMAVTVARQFYFKVLSVMCASQFLFAVCASESIGLSSTLCAWSVNAVVTHCSLVHVCCNGCTMVSI